MTPYPGQVMAGLAGDTLAADEKISPQQRKGIFAINLICSRKKKKLAGKTPHSPMHLAEGLLREPPLQAAGVGSIFTRLPGCHGPRNWGNSPSSGPAVLPPGPAPAPRGDDAQRRFWSRSHFSGSYSRRPAPLRPGLHANFRAHLFPARS